MPTPRPLIVRLCNMVGDTVLSIPALKLLESHGYELHLYGKGWAAGLLAGHGWHCVARAGSLSERIAQLRDLRRLCLTKDPSFDQRANTLVMPNSFSSAFEARWAGLRPAGYARDGRSLLLSRREDPRHGPHALEGFWQLACSFLGVQQAPPERIDMAVSPRDQAAADALLAARGISPGFICVVPFAAGVVDKMDKKWPHFGPLCQALSSAGRALVACPGPGETDLEQPGFEPVISLPDVKLGTYLGILRRAALVISNDTGPAHMAAAVGAPTLSVLGPTKPEQWRPWGPTVTVVSHRPDWPSMHQTLNAAQALLGQASCERTPPK